MRLRDIGAALPPGITLHSDDAALAAELGCPLVADDAPALDAQDALVKAYQEGADLSSYASAPPGFHVVLVVTCELADVPVLSLLRAVGTAFQVVGLHGLAGSREARVAVLVRRVDAPVAPETDRPTGSGAQEDRVIHALNVAALRTPVIESRASRALADSHARADHLERALATAASSLERAEARLERHERFRETRTYRMLAAASGVRRRVLQRSRADD